MKRFLLLLLSGVVAVATLSTIASAGAPSNRATDSYTPHVGPKGSVFVDTQTWRVLGISSAKSIGDSFSRQTADGVYLIFHLSVNNGKSQSVTISSDMVKFVVHGDTYSSDTNGETALMFSGANTFFLKDLGPHVTTTGYVVFDVPNDVLGASSEVCFHELGFGFSQGCIRT